MSPKAILNKYTIHIHYYQVRFGFIARPWFKKQNTYKTLLLNINLTNYFF